MKNDGGPTFPRPLSQNPNGDVVWDQEGMSLRDWFAGMALQGFIRSAENPLRFESNISTLALLSYSMADAMLKARS